MASPPNATGIRQKRNRRNRRPGHAGATQLTTQENAEPPHGERRQPHRNVARCRRSIAAWAAVVGARWAGARPARLNARENPAHKLRASVLVKMRSGRVSGRVLIEYAWDPAAPFQISPGAGRGWSLAVARRESSARLRRCDDRRGSRRARPFPRRSVSFSAHEGRAGGGRGGYDIMDGDISPKTSPVAATGASRPPNPAYRFVPPAWLSILRASILPTTHRSIAAMAPYYEKPRRPSGSPGFLLWARTRFSARRGQSGVTQYEAKFDLFRGIP